MDKYQRQNNKLEDKDQCLVSTPYGRGLVTRTRFGEYGKEENESKINFYYALSNAKYKQIQEIRLVNWSSGTLFSSNGYPSIEPEVGFDVISQFGRGIISEIIPSTQTEKEPSKKDGDPSNTTNNDKYVITLTSWRLANRSLVKCYLNKKSFRVVRKKFKHEMSAYDKVSMGKAKKKEATQQFIRSDYNKALVLYSEAIGFVRYVQHNANSTNELRADLLELMVTCNNNAATCCVKLKQWQEAKRFANNALILLDALYGKRGMKIHAVLGKDGVSDAKLFGEWKGKSLVIVAKALMNSKDYEQSIEWLKKAKEWIEQYIIPTENDEINDSTKRKNKEAYASSQSALSSMEKEINRLLHTCLQRKKAVNEKEKKRAKAMFGSKSVTTSKNDDPNTNSNKLETNANGTNNIKDTKNESKDDTQIEDKTPTKDQPFSILKKKSSSMESPHESIRKVKFEGLKENNDINDDENDEDEPWYMEHKEALIVAGTALALGATFFLRPKK